MIYSFLFLIFTRPPEETLGIPPRLLLSDGGVDREGKFVKIHGSPASYGVDSQLQGSALFRNF